MSAPCHYYRLLLAHSGGIGDYRCFGGAELRRSTDGGVSFGETVCAIPADWSPKKGWCELPVPAEANMSTYGIGNTHDGPVLVGHKQSNSLTLLFDCIPNATQTFDPPTTGERIWAVRSTDVSRTVHACMHGWWPERYIPLT